MNIYEKLLCIQSELKAPKGQFNKFGGYSYRSCEDILESVKPILARYKALLFLSDEIVEVGSRIYVMAQATLVNVEKPEEKLVATAYAREEESKKGMDGSQVTGAASSYARKYALNGLFEIDDTKDADATNDHGKGSKPAPAKPAGKPPVQKQKISADMGARLNTAIKAYAAFAEIPNKSVVTRLEKAIGKPTKDFDEKDGENALDYIGIWQEEADEAFAAAEQNN